MSTKKLLESLALNEKINHANDDINRTIANPNLGKNRDKIHAAGYEVTDYGSIKNPKTGKSVYPSDYSRDEKKKVDFKGKLDSERKNMNKTFGWYNDDENKIPKSQKIGKDRTGRRAQDVYDYDEQMQRREGISKNIKYYKKAVQDREESKNSVKYADNSMKHYEDKVTQAQKDLDFHKKYRDDRQKEAERAEEKRQALMAKVREKHQKTTESENLNESISEDEAAEMLSNLYDSYKTTAMEENFWYDLTNIIDLTRLEAWYNSLDEE